MTGALRFEARVRVVTTGGSRTANGDAVVVRDADAVTLLIAAATSYRTYETSAPIPRRVSPRRSIPRRARASTRCAPRTSAITSSCSIASRSTSAPRTPCADRRARARICRRRRSRRWPRSTSSIGRYLLICQLAARVAAGQPAGHLEREHDAAVGQQYTININTEMNYWPAEPTNLAECVEPLTAHGRRICPMTGARTAREMYGARGWVAHHNTDLWRATAPIDGPQWGMWPTGGAWLSLALWEHYEFSGDRGYLQRDLSGAQGRGAVLPRHARRRADAPAGSSPRPSLSPENPHPCGTSICAGPTMDEQILRDLFANAIEAAEILGVDAELAREVDARRARGWRRSQIGGAGQLQEWLDDWDMQAPEIASPARVAPVRPLSRARRSRRAARPNSRPPSKVARDSRRPGDRLGDRAGGINLWARLRRRRARATTS